MSKESWQPQSPLDGIIFDCDGTLSTIEGIDVLAEHNGCGKEVTALTADAMGTTGMNLELYQQRLALVNPSQTQIFNLEQEYYANRVEDAIEVIRILKHLNKSIYIVSAGLYPAVKLFGELLGIPEKNIYAVNIFFDEHGAYHDFDRTSPLVNRNGKRVIISEIIKHHKNTALIGDGLNDVEARDLVTRFIGYGGKFYRKNIAEMCEYYIRTPSFLPLLPLLLTQEEYIRLSDDEKKLYAEGQKCRGD